MKSKIIIALLAAACISASLAGCGDSDSSSKPASSAAKTDSSAAGKDVSTVDISTGEEVSTGDESEEDAPLLISYEATDEIKNASLSSGLIQIGTDVFRQGGYMTLGQFVDQYSGKYDCSDIDLTAEADKKFFRRYSVTEKGSELKMELYCKAPASGSGTAADSVIILFQNRESFAMDRTWNPQGIAYHCTDKKYSDIVSLFESEGLTPLEENAFPKGRGITCKKLQDNAGKYFLAETDETLNWTLGYGIVQLPDENLYGVKPAIAYYFTDEKDGEGVYFHLNWMDYGDSDYYQWG